MKKLLLLIVLALASLARAATGDILSATILANGFQADIVIEGLNTGGTYAFGLGSNNDPATGSPKVVFTVTSMGYTGTTLGTVVRTVYGTKQVRKAYPNDATNEESFSTNTTVRVALSDYVFVKDNTGAGNSGTAVTCVIGAGFYTQGGTPNSARTSFTVTNNSTQAYQMPLFQWDHIAGVCTADRVEADFFMAGNANALFGIAAVRFDATGATSSVNVNSTVTTQTATLRSATGLYANSFRASIAVSGFTTGELINLRARVYPVVGDTTEVLDTDSYTTVTDEPYGYTKPVLVYASTPKYGYVATSGGSDSNTGSTNQATAAAAPFATIGKAIQNDCTVIYLNAGTHAAVGTASASRRATNEWYVVQPAPGESSATVTVQIGTTKTYKCQRLRYEGVTVTIASTSSWLDGEAAANNLRFTNCIFNHGAVGKPTTNVGYETNSTKFENCTGDLGVTYWALESFSTARVNFQFDGCTFADSDAANTGIGAWYRVVACSATGPICFGTTTTSNVSPIQDNVFFEHNKLLGYSNTSTYGFQLAATRAVTKGASIRGNLVEQLIGGQPFFFVAADSSTVTCNGILFENNTLSGGRFNCGYNDTGSSAYDRKFWSVKNNILESWATKHDTFGTQNAARIGAWPVLFGVGWSGNFSPHIASIGASGSFMFEFIGLRSYQPAATGQPPAGSTNVTGYVQFTNRQSYSGSTGAGGGAYTLVSSSPARSLQYVLKDPYDLTGRARSGSDDAGAYAFVTGSSGSWFIRF